MGFMPYVVEKDGSTERIKDIYTRLLQDRVMFISGEINSAVADSIVSQLLFLDSDNPGEDIYMYINSPGGSIISGMAIFDTMNYVRPDINTVVSGLAASMGAFLLAAGTKGKRCALPNATIMIHQPLGGTHGQFSEIEIAYKHLLRTKEKVDGYLSKFTGQPLEKIIKDTDRDNYMSSTEALEYGLIDKIVERSPEK